MSDPARVPGVEGPIVRKGDAGYEDVRAGLLWNGYRPDRRPDVIVRAASVRDVPAAIATARAEGLRVAVRSGGHSWCGAPLRDGGMLLDLSALRRCVVDPARATATVEPGLPSGEFTRVLAGAGLAFPTGHGAAVALGGYLLSGGLGWNSGAWGPACASVRAIEAVTADGEVVRCDERENADLFWAARGAGPGFFAVVTAFRLALWPGPAAIATTSYVCHLGEVESLADWVADAAGALPADVEVVLTLSTDPASGEVVLSLSGTAFAGSHDEAARALAPLAEPPFTVAPLLRAVAEPTSMQALYARTAALWPEGHRYAADTVWSHADPGTLLTRLGDALGRAPSAKSLVLAALAPASRNPRLLGDTAFSVLGDAKVSAYAVWDDPSRDEANVRWLRGAMAAVAPLGTGHYIAEADLTADDSHARRSYTAADWARLGALRERHDPDGLFHSFPR
ncbi:FAD-binding oxidoreductase [Streptomyces sp. MI02-7b]|uniref:FAD-binding oxidoreductase n=1 Tax=Streptomyces sp. MI02-7b TaxID=462941 RepID=UPI0029A92D5E|nr:FAD-binding oxidoreductase [Streptomyces sp. MI02-7b]MDX3073726.1 FAD-binding oxidoreductase [Streptomyces sp. MI02-7b]